MSLKTKNTLFLVILAFLSAAILIQVAFEGFENPGLMVILGFFAAYIVIFISKRVLGPILQRPEDYYDHDKESAGLHVVIDYNEDEPFTTGKEGDHHA